MLIASPSAAARPDHDGRATAGRIIVIGGGDIGAGSVTSLLRASAAGRLLAREIVVVDRDPSCAAARVVCDPASALAGRTPVVEVLPALRLGVADWGEWLDRHLGGSAADDHLVPYHWGPHVLMGWIEREVARAGGRLERAGEVPSRPWPFEASTAAGDRALSHATWMCPPTCIEPDLCPHTRGPRDWSLAGELARAVPEAEPIVFRCLHLVWGVATVPVADVLEARQRLLAGIGRGPRACLVATASHCHGLARMVRLV